MNAPVKNLQVARATATRRIAELRERRGSALLDGQPVEPIDQKIAETERSLAALDDAAAVSEQRAQTAYKVDRLEVHKANVAKYQTARKNRLEAVAEAQAAAISLAGALKKVESSAALEDAAIGALGGQIDNPQNRQTRLWNFFKATLQNGLGSRWFAGVDLLAGTGSVSGTANWRDAESKHGDLSAFFARNTPKN